MDKNHFLIRKLSVDDLDQYDRLLRYAFQVTEGALQESGWEDEDIRQSKFPILARASVLGCFDGESLVSQFAVYPVKMNIHSVIYPVGFVTSVGHLSGVCGHGADVPAHETEPDGHAGEGADACAAVSLFHSPVPEEGLGNHIGQDVLPHQGRADCPGMWMLPAMCAA